MTFVDFVLVWVALIVALIISPFVIAAVLYCGAFILFIILSLIDKAFGAYYRFKRKMTNYSRN